MVTRLPGTFGKVSDEIGTEIPVGRAASAGVTAAAQTGSNRKESSLPIGKTRKPSQSRQDSSRKPKTVEHRNFGMDEPKVRRSCHQTHCAFNAAHRHRNGGYYL